MRAFFRSLLATIIGFFVCIFLLFILIAVIAGSSNKKTLVKDNSVLVLKPGNSIPERPVDNPLKNVPFISDDLDFPVSLKEILDNIKFAKTDPHIKGIYLDLPFVQAGLSTVEEIRNALIDFKKSGKFVYAYSEIYTQKSYYLASVADSIYLNPNGLFSFAGFHSEQIFFKGLLDKLEIKPILIRAGKYKSAGETFTQTSMSDANREQVSSFMNSSYDYFLSKIDSARHVKADELKNIADNLLIKLPADAVKYKLVDRLVYEDNVLDALRHKLGLAAGKDINQISMKDYVDAEHPVPSSGGNRIAVIYAVGDIGSGEGSETSIGSDKFAKAIREAREDDHVKAIVLRVNSPGGGALASDIIWREVLLAKQQKPVIASFGDVAASGGYYIAAPANYIFAEPTSITGSIGVFGLLPDLEAFWKDKTGITWDRVKTGKYADIGNPNREMTGEEQGIIQMLIDHTYAEFKDRVATGRKLKSEFVDSIAQGRVYSGRQAKDIGLVDGLGNLQDAIDMAAKKANITQYRLEILPEYNNGIFKMFNRSRMVSANAEIENQIGKENYVILQKAASIKDLKGVLMYYPFDLNIY
jgi:protease IV